MLALCAACADAAPPDDVEIVGNVKVAPAAGAQDQAPLVPNDPNMIAKADGPTIGAIEMAVSIYERPDHRSKKLGYLRVGTSLPRAEKPVAFDSCQGGFYNVLPQGYLCVDDGASIDPNHPFLKAKLGQADHTKPLPYDYGFVRAIAPRYYRLPSKREQYKYEMSLERHIRSFRRLEQKWQRVRVGSNDVRILPDGVALGRRRTSRRSSTSFRSLAATPARCPGFSRGGDRSPTSPTSRCRTTPSSPIASSATQGWR